MRTKFLLHLQSEQIIVCNLIIVELMKKWYELLTLNSPLRSRSTLPITPSPAR